ncbi:MAG: S41 family peptidase, partial [Anaerolineales bacterium]
AGYLVNYALDQETGDWLILDHAYRILRDNGWKDLPQSPSLEYGMIRGMLGAYDDPYTVFVEPVQHELESNNLEGSFGGIGVRLSKDNQERVVLHPIPDGPADQVGVLDGDRLISVADLQVDADTTLDAIQAAVRGPVGQWVEIGISRPPDDEQLNFRIKRAEIPLPSVTWHIDPDQPGMGVIEVNIVAASTPDEIQSAVKELQARGAQVFLLDLRDNYGGLLSAGVDVARLFLDQGEVIQQQYRGKQVETFRVEKPGPLKDIPLAVLVNQNTASASEIIAGSLQAHKRAVLIGTQTYGKDTIQLIFDLEDGSSLHVTAAKWWIPGLAAPLAGNGLQPDIPVESGEADAPDPYLRAAAQLLLGEGMP